jgi:erythronate-4-phosphate dehydrogenase
VTRRIVVDENVPLAREAFKDAGEVVLVPGRGLDREVLARADALVVRSVTRVNAQLLSGTPVRFVGTCTIGTDHLDIPWLESAGIAWTSAPGCNARSVAEFVFASLCRLHLSRRLDLSGAPRIGIVGCGHTGSALEKIVRALGLAVLRCDPPRQEREGKGAFLPLEELLRESDVVSLHVPLVREGEHLTRHLIGRREISLLRPGAVLVNASRGPVVDAAALLEALTFGQNLSTVLDVFDPEPAFPTALSAKVGQLSPHVAGYSLEGKIEGTRLVRAALGRLWRLPDWVPPTLPELPISLLAPMSEASAWDRLAALVLAVHDPCRDDASMRALAELPDRERGAGFDRLRREYPVRREWASARLETSGLPDEFLKLVCAAGFPTA